MKANDSSFQAPSVAKMGRILSHIPGLEHRHTAYGERYRVCPQSHPIAA